MPVQLFSHNMQAYEAAKAMLNRTSKAAVIHPTGTGKSFISFKWIEEHPCEFFVWLAPSDYIFSVQRENILRSVPDFPIAQITFLTYARLMGMTDEEISALSPYGIILDEFHRCGGKRWGGGVNRLLRVHPNAKLLGLSATRIRYLDDQRDMAEELFDGCIASEMTLGEAVVRGVLPTPTYVTTIYRVDREFQRLQNRVNAISSRPLRAESQKRLDNLRIAMESAEGLATIFSRHMQKRDGKYLVFCTSQSHMARVRKHAQEWFGGVDPEMHCYTAYSADPQTSRAFKLFVNDESPHLKLLFCINMFNEGVHVKDISGVILFRPTISPIVYKQQIGRALTTGTTNTPLIFDVVNNFDSLSSYGTIQAEMDDAVEKLHREKRDDEIRVEKLKVIEQIENSTELFRKLDESLSSTWELFYQAVYSYYLAHGNLKMSCRYVDKNGFALARWLDYQRHMRKQNGLSKGQIERLDDLGMVWEDRVSRSWQEGYRHARAFYEKYGHLNVANTYVCKDGYALGTWIHRMRQQKNGSMAGTALSQERIQDLEAMGMKWSVYDDSWSRGYAEAKRFFDEHGHLKMRADYTTDTGFPLGHWLSTQRQAKTGSYGRRPLTKWQMADLDALSMPWETRCERLWKINYAAAKEYYEKYGNLRVPSKYETASGIKLGNWVCNMRYGLRHGKALDPERHAQLEAIGMFID